MSAVHSATRAPSWARRARLGGAAVVATLLTGCVTTAGLMPRSRPRPANSLAASAALATAAVDGTWPVPTWWKALGDPQLDALIEAGLADGPTLQEARARTRLAVAAARSAGASRVPRLDVSGSSTRARFPEHWLVPPPIAGTWNTQNDLAVSLQYDLDLWGKTRSAQDRAIDASRASALDADAARVTLSTAIAHTYVALQRAYLDQDVERTLLTEREQIYALTLDGNRAGLNSMLDVKQAESALPAAKERITQIDESIELSRDALAALIGAGPDRGRALRRPHMVSLAPPALPTRLAADLLGRRPDILALRWRIESARQGISGAKAQFYPDVNLAALAGFESLGSGTLLDAANAAYQVGPAVSLPLFDGGRLRASLAGRDADYDVAVDQYNQAIADALRDVVDQVVSLRSIRRQRAELRDGLATAQDAYDLALQRYRAGVGNYLQVLTTHGELLAQRKLEVALRARSWDVSIDLVRALGGGYVPSPGATPAETRVAFEEN
jgi:NodT family efflux transporter outer membrane factor (OMF) lipoprotein